MTTRAKLPGLPAPNFADPAIQRWAQAVSERLEVREGARGDPLERVVTWRDFDASVAGGLGQRISSSPSVLSGTAQIPTGNGETINIDMETFAKQLKSTQLYRDLQFSISDPNRFTRLGKEVNELLARKLTAEAAVRSAQISRTDIKLLELGRSVAATSTELTAAMETTAAGIRSTQFAIATETTAIAGQVTALEARLQVEVNPEDLLPVLPAAAYADLAALIAAVPAASADTRKYYRVAGTPEDLYRSNGTTYSLVGTEESAKLEEVLLVTADKSLGLEAQYTLKVNAGNAIAGFGIAATERDGVPESAFIIQADKFALSTPFTFSQELTPTATAVGQTWYKPSTQVSYRATAVGTGGWVVYTPLVPFGVDTTTGNVFMSGSLRVGGASAPTATQVSTAATNFDSRNDRNGAAVLAPTIASDGTAVDHTINTDGSADLSFEWLWSGAEADIDGFIITTYTSTTNAAYTFGTTPAAETTFIVPASKRAIISYGLPANNYYKLGVQAYRVVDPDVNAAGIIRSAMVVPSLSAENPYRPSANVAFAGDITGTVNGTAVATVVTGAANGTTALTAVNDPTTGLSTRMGNAVKNVMTGVGGIKVGTIDWNTSGTIVSGQGTAITTAGIFARNSSGQVTFSLDGTTGNAVFLGSITASGIFTGDATGTLNGTAASTVVTGASNGSTALTAVNDPTTGLATRMGNAVKNILSGVGGIRAGTIDWDSSGTVISGQGTAMTSGGIFARNSSGTITFAINSATGNATFAGDISTAGQVFANGTTSSAEGTACIVGASATSGVRGGVFIATNTSGAVGVSTSGAGLYGKTESTSANTPGVLASSGAGGIAIATATGSIQINSFNSNMIIGTATNTGNNNLIIKEGAAGARLDNQMIIYGALSTTADTTLGIITEQDVVAGTGAFAGILQIRIAWNGVEYWLPLQAV